MGYGTLQRAETATTAVASAQQQYRTTSRTLSVAALAPTARVLSADESIAESSAMVMLNAFNQRDLGLLANHCDCRHTYTYMSSCY
jgi:hypothetical protein